MRHHVPPSVCYLIANYYKNFRLRVCSSSVISEWQTLEKGIITGCTMSAVLFSLTMHMLVKFAEVECRGPLCRSGVRQSPIRAYMDDLTVTTTSVMEGIWFLKSLERNMTRARMYFKPAKSRSLVLKKGKVMERVRFSVTGETIPTLSEKPIKSLGKTFNSSLKDTAAKQKTIKDLEEWLTKIDKSGLPGRFKAWLFQHAVLPSILWPLLVYDILITTVESLERAISNRLRRWLGLPRCLSGAALYGNSNSLRPPPAAVSWKNSKSRRQENCYGIQSLKIQRWRQQEFR